MYRSCASAALARWEACFKITVLMVSTDICAHAIARKAMFHAKQQHAGYTTVPEQYLVSALLDVACGMSTSSIALQS